MSAILLIIQFAPKPPEAPDLQALFAVMVERGVTAAAMEVSSHSLALGRVGGTAFDVAVFTNLSQDHLDFHADLEDYFRAKASLFMPPVLGVVNIDDLLAVATTEQCLQGRRPGHGGADRLGEVRRGAGGGDPRREARHDRSAARGTAAQSAIRGHHADTRRRSRAGAGRR